MKRTDRDEYSVFHSKLTRHVCGSVALSVLIVTALYRLLWKRRMGDVIVWFLVHVMNMNHQEAFYFYADHFRLNKGLFFCVAVFLVFAVMLWWVFRGMSHYFSEINQGIESLLTDDGEQIHLSPEMLPFERKLNAVKRTLAERKEQTALAERGNTMVLRLDENLTVRGDAEKLARVFGNILKNAAAYSDPKTEITVTAERAERNVIIRFQNRGNDIPAEKLEALFDKFYRLDQARSTGTGGTDLGLAIAKEIVLLHGGSIQAFSENHTVTFTLCLPDGDS